MIGVAEIRARLGGLVVSSAAGRWYAEQSRRDQRVLALLGLFLAGVGLWVGLWLPVQDRLAVAERRHSAALEDRRWVVEHRDEARAAAARSGRGGQTRSGQALLSTVADSARRSGLTLNRFQPEGSDALSVFLDEAPFGELVVWLERLEREQGIRVRQASVDASGRSGHVRARLVLY